MALRDQPYLPLYVQDFLTDEKLNECSASSTGVYIRLLCIMHKNEQYGTILLKQKDKQTDKQIINFASKLAKQMPYSEDTISDALEELLTEKVLILENDMLIQKRMVKDNELSEIRALAGSKGGKKTVKNNKNFAKGFAQAKDEANTEYEYVYINEIISYLNDKINSNYKSSSKKNKELIQARLNEKFTVDDFKKVIDKKTEEWTGTEFEKFLRPETLFSNKFESYLNQKIIKATQDKQVKKPSNIIQGKMSEEESLQYYDT